MQQKDLSKRKYLNLVLFHYCVLTEWKNNNNCFTVEYVSRHSLSQSRLKQTDSVTN